MATAFIKKADHRHNWNHVQIIRSCASSRWINSTKLHDSASRCQCQSEDSLWHQIGFISILRGWCQRVDQWLCWCRIIWVCILREGQPNNSNTWGPIALRNISVAKRCPGKIGSQLNDICQHWATELRSVQVSDAKVFASTYCREKQDIEGEKSEGILFSNALWNERMRKLRTIRIWLICIVKRRNTRVHKEKKN